MVIGIKVGGEDEKGVFVNCLNFEIYNLGYLMMVGIIYCCVIGKIILFDVVVKVMDFFCYFYEIVFVELVRNVICFFYYMGVVEMYCVIGNFCYLEFFKNLIDICGMVENGIDDNQDCILFCQ